MSPGIPGWFIAIFVLIVLLGIVSTAWRISVTRRMARDAGLDPDTATAVTMLSRDGIDATYLASTLAARSTQQPPAQPQPEPARSVEERLMELQGLHARGLITQAEYDSRRQEILGSI